MLLYRSKYLIVNYLEVQYLFHVKWTKMANKLDEKQIKDEVINFTNNMVNRKAKFIFCDITDIQNIADKQLFDWHDNNILNKIASKEICKKAILLSNNYFFEDYDFKVFDNKIIEIRFFNNSKKAMNWLLTNAKRKH